ncbi:hypothetical protein WB66_10755 [bacteria symbiont BFo1 of Frankliniella occidentalis]|nr:hypothetical protein AI28_20960 [bacteria symbiont BFo1 of Frankliniella occidentalis]KYP84698.1 hypothetical protein WB66_10755 [bacteria symbiont BFo1 of Frankliniella occidentalis]KYP89911.1 hypothetical protein WB91_10995 [bacteria symbiont BFo1 of Frankliniella occidentalis]
MTIFLIMAMGADEAINQGRPDAIYTRTVIAVCAKPLGQFAGCADQMRFSRYHYAAPLCNVCREAPDVSRSKIGIKTQLCQHRRAVLSIQLTTAIFSGKKPQFTLS